MKPLRTTSIISALLATLIIASSCASENRTYSEDLGRRSFDGWIKQYAPKAQAVGEVYMEYIERSPSGSGATPIYNNSYVRVNYTANTFDKNIFTTRTESVSKLLGRFAYTTHYTSDYFYFGTGSSKVCAGLKTALENMREGDSVRIYIPLNLGYGTGGEFTGGSGAYTGQLLPSGGAVPGPAFSYLGRPIIFNMRLSSVSYDPFIDERMWVENYAKTKWGMTKPDTLGLFVRIIKENPSGHPLKDSAATIYYENYFPSDGFLLSTNIDTVAKKHHRYTGDEQDYVAYTVNNSDGNTTILNKAYYIAIQKMRKGEIAEVISTSNWAFGATGLPNNVPEILPYQPVRYIIYAKDDKKE